MLYGPAGQRWVPSKRPNPNPSPNADCNPNRLVPSNAIYLSPSHTPYPPHPTLKPYPCHNQVKIDHGAQVVNAALGDGFPAVQARLLTLAQPYLHFSSPTLPLTLRVRRLCTDSSPPALVLLTPYPYPDPHPCLYPYLQTSLAPTLNTDSHDDVACASIWVCHAIEHPSPSPSPTQSDAGACGGGHWPSPSRSLGHGGEAEVRVRMRRRLGVKRRARVRVRARIKLRALGTEERVMLGMD